MDDSEPQNDPAQDQDAKQVASAIVTPRTAAAMEALRVPVLSLAQRHRRRKAARHAHQERKAARKRQRGARRSGR